MHRAFVKQHHSIHPNQQDDHAYDSEDTQMMDAEPLSDPTEHATHQHHGVSMEEVEDEGEGELDTADGPILVEEFDGAGTALGEGEAPRQTERRRQQAQGQDPWAPFDSLDEWRFAEWMMKKGISQQSRNELLKLEFVSQVQI